jgi:hypothetical protein
MAIQLNGYAIDVNKIRDKERLRFITLTDEQGKRHHFSMIKPDGKWIIRNPLTVPSFIVDIETDIANVI